MHVPTSSSAQVFSLLSLQPQRQMGGFSSPKHWLHSNRSPFAYVHGCEKAWEGSVYFSSEEPLLSMLGSFCMPCVVAYAFHQPTARSLFTPAVNAEVEAF